MPAHHIRDPRAAARPSLAVLAAVGALFASVAAHAGTPCTQDSDCIKGFSCQTLSVGGCAEPAIACAAGEACDASTVAPIDCNVPEQHACEPGPCTTDADCASGMTCLASSSKSCSSPACADPSQGCSTTVTCTMVTGPSTCIPNYELPCTADADCGDHFTCTPGTTISCWGSGGSTGGAAAGGTGASGAGAPLVAEDAGSAPTTGTPTTGTPTSGCTTMPSGTSGCVPDRINCTTDGDCPATWSCTGSLEGVATAGCATGVPSEVDGAAPPTPCDPVPPVSTPTYCVPPSYGSPAGSPLGTSASTGGGSGSNQRGTTSGTMTSGSSAGTSTAPTTPAAQSNEAATPADGSGGCGVGGGASGAAGWLFAAAMAFGVGLVRRRRASSLAVAVSRRR
jgi:hypothetical protein